MGRRAIGIGEEITNGREGSFMRQNLRIEIQVEGTVNSQLSFLPDITVVEQAHKESVVDGCSL